ncbi:MULTISPECIES: enoyl-CoA hydratase [Cupriavidus]|uniref:Enoyl-CoA hydratase n=1 Tax=Cupriavidus alkaliphilus TaxID=942866 RepID=A0A7W4VE16_9BURK|nr:MULTISPECIES: enoyl-CoA hydratase [Cupriavidus]MBB3009890.1 enoyl-CoA hydratase [Cupriavidus alkaliphilus]TDF62631.1 enoyl-CoA hydratase [Cupriavidus sp. L7L]
MEIQSSTANVLFETIGPVGVITLNRPEVRNAQNGALLYDLDRALERFAYDDKLAVAIVRGNGPHFSSGHDLGKTADRHVSFERKSLWWDHVGKTGVENRFARESELYVGLCRRWRDLPKPTIAAVQGACIMGGLMLAWSCDLIVASEDAYFADAAVDFGIPGVELFGHPWELGSRRAKEFLFTAERLSAAEAYRLGMVSRLVPREQLFDASLALAQRIAQRPRLGLALAKKAINQCDDLMGYRSGTDLAFGLHQLAHAHNAESGGSPNGAGSPQLVKQTLSASSAG